MGQSNIRHRENDDKARPKGEKNLINKKSNKSDINRVDKESTPIVTYAHTQFTK